MAQDIQVGRIAQALAAVLSDTVTELPTLNDASAELLNEIVAEAFRSANEKAKLAALNQPQLRKYVVIRYRQLKSRESPGYHLRAQLRRHVRRVLEHDRPTTDHPEPLSLLDEGGRYVVARIREAVAHRLFKEEFSKVTSIPALVSTLSSSIWNYHESKVVSEKEITEVAITLRSKTAEVTQLRRDGPKLKAALLTYLSDHSQAVLPHLLRCSDSPCIRKGTGWSDTTLRRRLAVLEDELKDIRSRYDLTLGELKSAFLLVTGARGDEVEEQAIEMMLSAEVDPDATIEVQDEVVSHGSAAWDLSGSVTDKARIVSQEQIDDVMSMFTDTDLEAADAPIPGNDSMPSEQFSLMRQRILSELENLFGGQ